MGNGITLFIAAVVVNEFSDENMLFWREEEDKLINHFEKKNACLCFGWTKCHVVFAFSYFVVWTGTNTVFTNPIQTTVIHIWNPIFQIKSRQSDWISSSYFLSFRTVTSSTKPQLTYYVVNAYAWMWCVRCVIHHELKKYHYGYMQRQSVQFSIFSF